MIMQNKMMESVCVVAVDQIGTTRTYSRVAQQ